MQKKQENPVSNSWEKRVTNGRAHQTNGAESRGYSSAEPGVQRFVHYTLRAKSWQKLLCSGGNL